MKILILTFYYEPDLCAGSFRSTALVNAMLDQLPEDVTIEVITTLPNRYNSYNSSAEKLEIHPRLTINRIALPSHNSGMIDQSKAFLAFSLGALRLCNGKNYDFIFATSSRLMTAVLGTLISKIYRIKIYLDIRDIFLDTIKEIFPGRIFWFPNLVLSILEKWVIRNATHVNLVSQGFAPYFLQYYPNQKFSFHTNGIDQEFIEAQPTGRKERSSPELEVLYAGNIGEGQGMHNIIPKLAKQFEGRLNFIIIGDGGRKNYLISAIEDSACKNVKVLSPVNRNELIRYYQKCDILFLHLNDYDAFKKVLPSKIFEYAALGKPIWAGVSGYAADFLRNNINNVAVFSPCNVDDAVKSFDALEIVTEPRKDFILNFSRENIMNKMALDILTIIEGN